MIMGTNIRRGGILSAWAGNNSVMPMGLTGSRLAFYTGGTPDNTLHS